jgi:hypothetical protein
MDIPGPFLNNGSLNTFPRQRIGGQQWRYCCKQGVSAWFVSMGYKKDNWDDQVSSVRESVKRGLEPEAQE